MEFTIIGALLVILAIGAFLVYSATRKEEPVEDDFFWDEEYNAPEERRQ